MNFLQKAGILLVTVTVLSPVGQSLSYANAPAPVIPEGTSEQVIEQMYEAVEAEAVKNMTSFNYSLPGKASQVQIASASQTPLRDLFTDVNSNHWAYDAVNNAAKKGIVSGYGDGTFRPEKEVSRAEFIKMTIEDSNYAFSAAKSKEWFSMYVETAKDYKLIQDGDFAVGDFNTPMSRLEMAKFAVRASQLSANSDNEAVLVATKKGLVHGVGNGNLNLQGTTTRAQSVVIIDRIAKIRAGETLPVDQEAINSAESQVNQKVDPWGDTIRTTNLPKNHKDFSYILEKIPNYVYEEVKHGGEGTGDLDSKAGKLANATAAKIDEYPGIKEHKDILNQTLIAYGNQILNVDYRTINSDWAEEMMKYFDHVVYHNLVDRVRTDLDSYVEYVKENKIVMSGKIEPELSTLRMSWGEYAVTVKVTINVRESALFDGSPRTFAEFVLSNSKALNPSKVIKSQEESWYTVLRMAANGSVANQLPLPGSYLVTNYPVNR